MSTSDRDVERVAGALLSCTGPVTQILDHMARAPEPMSPQRAVEVLRGLLCTALAPLAATATREELRSAARLIDAAAELIADEILLVPHAPRQTRRPECDRR
jgi:hypothetical protein